MTSHKNFGFTLIEIILSVAVLAIITGSSYVALIQFSRSQSLNSDYLSLKNNLNLAKSNASSQVLTCRADQTLVGFRVIRVNDKSYKIDQVCQDGNGLLDYKESRTPKLRNNITVADFEPILFQVITGEVQDIPSEGVIITLTGNNGSTRSVKVFPNGRIE